MRIESTVKFIARSLYARARSNRDFIAGSLTVKFDGLCSRPLGFENLGCVR